MRTTKVDIQHLKSIMQNAAYLNPGLKLILCNERDQEEEITFYSENGLLDYIKELLKDEDGNPVSCLMKPFLVHGKAEAQSMGKTIQMEADIAVTLPVVKAVHPGHSPMGSKMRQAAHI